MVIFLNFYITSNLHPLQIGNCDSNSRLVVDEDDNGKFRPERVKLKNMWVKWITYLCRCSFRQKAQFRRCIFSKNSNIFRHLKLKIALAIAASNDKKYNWNNSARQASSAKEKMLFQMSRYVISNCSWGSQGHCFQQVFLTFMERSRVPSQIRLITAPQI